MGFVGGDGVRWEVAAVAVVHHHLFAGPLLFSHLLQALWCAIAAVGPAPLDQFLRHLFVHRQPLGLDVRTTRPADGIFLGVLNAQMLQLLQARPLVPVQPQPAQTVHDDHNGLRLVAGPVGVLDAQDELTAHLAGKEPVEYRRPHVADMWLTGGARCHTNANCHSLLPGV